MCRLKVKIRKKIYHASIYFYKAEVAISIPDKINFKVKKITSAKEGYCKIIKSSIHQEDITIIDVYLLYKRASKYTRQKLIDLKSLKINKGSWRFQYPILRN